jgi:hypothetical protein
MFLSGVLILLQDTAGARTLRGGTVIPAAALNTPLRTMCEVDGSSAENCPHEIWLVLSIDSQGWYAYDKFTLRVSWPASVRWFLRYLHQQLIPPNPLHTFFWTSGNLSRSHTSNGSSWIRSGLTWPLLAIGMLVYEWLIAVFGDLGLAPILRRHLQTSNFDSTASH